MIREPIRFANFEARPGFQLSRGFSISSECWQNREERPSRNDLLARCWPGTHVSDDALNRSIWKLREAFRELGWREEVVATVPKRGYRLLLTESSDPKLLPTADRLRYSPPVRPPRRINFPALLILLTVTGSTFLFRVGRSSSDTPFKGPREDYIFQPLTSSIGYESEPTFSPDGSRIAYQHFAKEGLMKGQTDILVQDTAGGSVERVAGSLHNELAPSWSPEGGRLALIRVEEGQARLIVVDLESGLEDSLLDCGPAFEPPDYWVPHVIWGKYGHSLIYSERSDPSLPSRLLRFDLSTRSSVLLTLPSSSQAGDRLMALSPDGKRLAVVRTRVPSVEDLFVLDLEDMSERRITMDGRAINGVGE